MRSIHDVFNSGTVHLGTITKELDETAARAIVFLLLDEVVQFFNVGKTMNETQVATTCDLIIETYPYLTISDLKLCFRKAMLGTYGKQYDRIDGAIILAWIKAYDHERALLAEHLSISEANVHRKEDKVITQGISYEERIKQLEEQAADGNPKAIEALGIAREIQQKLFPTPLIRKKS